jgi:aconitase A
VIHAKDGVAFPDTLVGTDSHTPHVDALGVVAIGVGGLEAESVMLGRASWMRLPEIVGVELTGRAATGHHRDRHRAGTDRIPAQGPRWWAPTSSSTAKGAAALTLGDRATISNMAPEYGATAAMFSIDEQTITYLRLTGRADEQVRALVETYAKAGGPVVGHPARTHEYERTLAFDLSTVVRNMAGPSNPHAPRGHQPTWPPKAFAGNRGTDTSRGSCRTAR